MLKTATAALLMCCTGALAGPSGTCSTAGAQACSTDGATTQTVAAQSCATACPTEGASIQTVAGEPGTCSTQAAGACQTACDASAMAAAIPAMNYKVGDEVMTCPVSASQAAEAHHTAMHYLVSGVAFENQYEAMEAHTAALNDFVDGATRVSFDVNGEKVCCPVMAADKCAATGATMRYRVGPATFDSAEEAVRAAAMAYGAAQTVAMTYAVGDETTTCSASAGAMAQSCSGKVEYVVNGERTACAMTAAHMLAEARAQAAVQALTAQMQPAQTQTAQG